MRSAQTILSYKLSPNCQECRKFVVQFYHQNSNKNETKNAKHKHHTFLEKVTTPSNPKEATDSIIIIIRFVIENKFKSLYNTGWSKETVDCNLFLTDPNFLKSAITQWFLESLYREVLVFWCFKSVRCVEFCLSEIFQYGHLLHHTRP